MMRSMKPAVATLLLTLLSAPLAAQSVSDGALLVASPALEDPNFAKSVVLVLRHDENGTLGLVVNRATSVPPVQLFPEYSPALDGYAGTLFRGGPVAPTRVLFLVTGLAAAVVQGPELVEDLFVSGDAEQLPQLASLAEGPGGLRLYAGHAEWAPGQLDREVALGNFTVAPASVALVFGEPAAMWEQAAALQSGVVADAGRR
jgi:putative transcriptional regulator